MAKPKVRVKLNHGALKKITQSTRQALEATGEQMLADKIRSQQIPFDEGTLQNVQTMIDKGDLDRGKLSIVHDTPYALRLYYHPEYNFTQTFNVNARGEWWEDYLSGDKKGKPKEWFAHYLKRYGGGVIQ